MYCSVNAEQEIPNWTGFNYLLSDDKEGGDYHVIGYLPAINQSPTSQDTVLELLTQSKLKAEKIDLEEIDVVLDMAIYAKAFKILMNPRYIDLKNFIVLRLEAFHTMCIFIAVIGKRFGDAGLRNLVIESNLLGESSVEQMLKGKHYNNAMRVLKYFYGAMKRHMIESFQPSAPDSSDTVMTHKELTESLEFRSFVSSPTKESLDQLDRNHEVVISQIHDYEESLLLGSLGSTASFWSSFLKMIQILLDFTRSIKLGNWKLHLLIMPAFSHTSWLQ